MAHVWLQDSSLTWVAYALDAHMERHFLLTGKAIVPVASLDGGSLSRNPVLMRTERNGGPAWVLITCAEDVRVNGEPSAFGIRALHDRDEISVPGYPPVFFSTEEMASVEPFPGAERPIHCARCKQPILPDDPAVRCPGCGTWYHQITEDEERPFPCWTYSDTCIVDGYPTDLGAGYQWTPEELWHVA